MTRKTPLLMALIFLAGCSAQVADSGASDSEPPPATKDRRVPLKLAAVPTVTPCGSCAFGTLVVTWPEHYSGSAGTVVELGGLKVVVPAGEHVAVIAETAETYEAPYSVRAELLSGNDSLLYSAAISVTANRVTAVRLIDP